MKFGNGDCLLPEKGFAPECGDCVACAAAFGMTACVSCTMSRDSSKKPRWEGQEQSWIGEIAQQVHTGDILLFSSKHSTSNITKFFTRSRFDHIGIVVKPSPNRAYIVEWGGGLFACDLIERLNEYAEWDALDLVLRQLRLKETTDRRVVEERMEQFSDTLFREKMGQNRAIPMGQVIKAARDQIFSKSSSYSKEEVVVDDLNALFCSKTVAVAYKAAGLLAGNRRSDKFLPKHFSSGFEAFLDLQGGASLGPEQRVTFESRRMRDAVSNILKLPLLEVIVLGSSEKERRSALLIEKFVRRIAARRELRRRRSVGAPAGASTSLYEGAEHVGTKERCEMLKQMAHAPHAKPADTLQITWIDDEIPLEAGGEDV